MNHGSHGEHGSKIFQATTRCSLYPCPQCDPWLKLQESSPVGKGHEGQLANPRVSAWWHVLRADRQSSRHSELMCIGDNQTQNPSSHGRSWRRWTEAQELAEHFPELPVEAGAAARFLRCS